MATEAQQNVFTEGTVAAPYLRSPLSMFLVLENLRNDRKIVMCLFIAASNSNALLSHIEMMLWISHKSLTTKPYELVSLGSW